MKTFTIGETVTKGIDVVYEPGGVTRLFDIPIRQAALAHLKYVLEPALYTLHWIDLRVGEGGVAYLDKEASRDDRRALVLVQTAEGAEGSVTLHPNTLVDRFDEKHQTVYREPFGPFPPPGIELIGQRRGEDGGVETLLVMHPGASMRIHRTGDLQGAAPEMRLQWDGTWSKEAKGPARTGAGSARMWGMQLDKHWPKGLTNGNDDRQHRSGTPTRETADVPVRGQGKHQEGQRSAVRGAPPVRAPGRGSSNAPGRGEHPQDASRAPGASKDLRGAK